MNTSTRLILLLTMIVGAIMTGSSFVSLRQREAALEMAMRDELRAHALTLQIALEKDYSAGRIADAQLLINGLGRNEKIYGVVLFDELGQLTIVSDDLIAEEIRWPPELNRVLTSGQPVDFVREVKGRELFSIIMPLQIGGGRRGAFEIAQPLSVVQSDISRARRNWIVTTLLLIATIFLVVLVVLRRSLSQPIRELLGGASAIGRGDFEYRVIVPRGGNEFAQLAREFNRMADRLAEQRRRAAQEAEVRFALERQLRHSESLAAVGRLAAGVAHEIGAPLNVIDARAEQLLEKPDAAPETRERNLRLIRKQTARITHIVRQLLTLARPYNLRRKVIDIGVLITETLDHLSETARTSQIQVEFIPPREALMCHVDADFVRQVLTNVFVNGLQAMPRGGRLLVETEANAAQRDGTSFGVVRVTDTGDGIAAEHLAHIFEPFYTTKDVGSGTGLGLAVSRRIVEEHGGWIEAGNNPSGEGAIFSLYLPLYIPPNDDQTSDGRTVTKTESELTNESAITCR